jgi:hypothetical protein
MKRLLAFIAALAILLVIAVPAVLAAPTGFAAERPAHTGRVLVSINGGVDIPAGDHLDALVVVNGDARVSGDVNTVVMINGNATLSGATAETLVVVNGTADLQAGTTVLGNVRTLNGTVTQAPGATVHGSVKSVDAEIAALGVLLIPAFILLFLGLGLLTIVAALLVAALGARQVRAAESLISERPGPVLVAGIAGSIGLPLLAILMILTVVGAPIGIVLLLILGPAVAYLAWIVAAIWVGYWMVARLRGSAEPERPYLAAVLGVIVLALAGLLPFVTAIASLFGFGALLLMAWRIFRHEPPLPGALASA